MRFSQLIKEELDTDVPERLIPGGKSEGKSLADIAKLHNVSIESLKKQVEMGLEVEKEHTSNPKIALNITFDHIYEFPTYYTALKEMENKLSAQKKKE